MHDNSIAIIMGIGTIPIIININLSDIRIKDNIIIINYKIINTII